MVVRLGCRGVELCKGTSRLCCRDVCRQVAQLFKSVRRRCTATAARASAGRQTSVSRQRFFWHVVLLVCGGNPACIALATCIAYSPSAPATRRHLQGTTPRGSAGSSTRPTGTMWWTDSAPTWRSTGGGATPTSTGTSTRRRRVGGVGGWLAGWLAGWWVGASEQPAGVTFDSSA